MRVTGRMKAVFLDRDGVINEDRDDYVKNVSELRVFPYAAESIRMLNDAGWPVFVVSNQQGIAKGVMSEDDLAGIEDEITRQVSSAGGRISGFYYCRHLSEDCCTCRKPEPGLLLQAAEEHGVDLPASVLVGDNERDILAGRAAGCATVLVLSGKLTRSDAERSPSEPDMIARDLLEACALIVKKKEVSP